MRFDKQVVYPHPVASPGTYDYKVSEFYDAIEWIPPTDNDDALVFKASYTLKNPALVELISSGRAKVMLSIACPWTLLNEMFDLGQGTRTIRLDPDKIHGKVSLRSVLVSVENIVGFSSRDFADDFVDLKFDIPKNSVLGFCDQRDLYVDREAFGSAESVIDVVARDVPDNIWSLNAEGDKIEILVSDATMAKYAELNAHRQGKAGLMAGLYAPAVQQAIELLKVEKGDSYLWQRIFLQKCALAGIDIETELSGNISQMLLGYPLLSLFNSIKDNTDED